MNGPGTVSNRTQVQVPIDQNETIYIDTIKPNVYNVAVATLKTSTSVDVEKFLGGIPNQTLTVKVQGAVTLKYNAGGIGSIMTNTGADKLLFADRVYKFTNIDNKWYEQDDSASGGGGGSTSFPLTINDSNSGATSPALFNGSVGVTISANTVGAVALSDFVGLGDAEWVQLDGTYNDPSWLNSLAYSKLTGVPSLSGYVVGPASATDNALVRFDNTTGKLVQDSGLFLSDANIFSAATLSTANSIPITINATNALLTLIGRGITLKPGAITPFKIRNPGDTEDILTVGSIVAIRSSTNPQLTITDGLFSSSIGMNSTGQLEYNSISTNPLHQFLDPVRISGNNAASGTVYGLEMVGEANNALKFIGIGTAPVWNQVSILPDIIAAQLSLPAPLVAGVTNAYGLVIEDITIGSTINRAIKTGTGFVEFGDKVLIQSDNGLEIQSSKVIGIRKTGWALPTGTIDRTTFDTTTVTLSELAERVYALINDLHSGGSSSTHGLLTT